MTVAALGAALLAAGCTTNADHRAEQYAEAGGQMEYNIGVVKAEQERIQAEEYYAEQARQKAKAQKQAAKAKADKARAQANAKANAAKKAKQDKLDALALRERELKVRLAEVKLRSARPLPKRPSAPRKPVKKSNSSLNAPAPKSRSSTNEPGQGPQA